MRRKNDYDKSKLTQVATNKTVVSAYVDAFPIEQVKLRFAEFQDAKNTIDIYLSFEDALRIAEDIKNGTLLKELEGSTYPIQISFGGSSRDGIIESRQMTFGMTSEKVYMNAQKGPGKTTSTGAIIPDGPPIKKISVGMSVNDFKGLFFYIEAGINAFLPSFVESLVKASEDVRVKLAEKTA